jgi:hypothetical protein
MNSEGHSSFQDLSGTETEAQSPGSANRIIREFAEYSRKVAQFISQGIKSESRSIAAGQLSLASSKLDAVAEALREAADKLREKRSHSLASVMEIGSESAMRLSDGLRGTSPEMIIDEVEDFARNKPGIFLGSAVFAGILLGQLFFSVDERSGKVQEFHPRKESSIEYRPANDEGEYYVPH